MLKGWSEGEFCPFWVCFMASGSGLHHCWNIFPGFAHSFQMTPSCWFLLHIDHLSSIASQGALMVKNPPANAARHKRHRFNSWIRKVSWRRAWQPTPVFLPGESDRRRSLSGFSQWCHKECDTTEATEHAHMPGMPDRLGVGVALNNRNGCSHSSRDWTAKIECGWAWFLLGPHFLALKQSPSLSSSGLLFV